MHKLAPYLTRDAADGVRKLGPDVMHKFADAISQAGPASAQALLGLGTDRIVNLFQQILGDPRIQALQTENNGKGGGVNGGGNGGGTGGGTGSGTGGGTPAAQGDTPSEKAEKVITNVVEGILAAAGITLRSASGCW